MRLKPHADMGSLLKQASGIFTIPNLMGGIAWRLTAVGNGGQVNHSMIW